MSNSEPSLCEQYTDGTVAESGNLVLMKFYISFSLEKVNTLSVFNTTNTLLMLVLTFPTRLKPLGVVELELLIGVVDYL